MSGTVSFYSSLPSKGEEKEVMTLKEEIRQLVAIGAAVGTNCQPCLRYWINAAKNRGTDPALLAEAIRIATAVRNGAAAKIEREAERLLNGETAPEAEPAKRCACQASPRP